MATSYFRFPHAEMLARESRRDDPAAFSSVSAEGMVATSHYLATAAGAEMLARGGDAADAAVAASLALGACEPAGSGLGGMAMAVVHRAASGETIGIAGPCRAPALATPESFPKRKPYRGYRAIAVPGNPAVLALLHARYGRLDRATLFGPAIECAKRGYPFTPLQRYLAEHYRRALSKHSAGGLFLDAAGQPLAPGAIVRQPVLARTLERLSTAGFEDFYKGETARLIARDMERRGGFVRESDLAAVTPLELPVVETDFGDLRVRALGPPGGGITLLAMLNVWREIAGEDLDLDSPHGAVVLAEIILHCREDRRRLGLRIAADNPGAAAELLTADHARSAATRIRAAIGEGETSHIAVADRDGNIVSMTQSIERSFGAAEIGPELGFLYNGFVRGFKIDNPRHPHFLRPGALARSNAAPTVLLKDGRPWGAIGNTGSERLASGILETLIRLRRQAPFDAVTGPRLHCTPEKVVLLEQSRFAARIVEALRQRGFQPEETPPFTVGGLNLVWRLPQGFCGVADPRRDGIAAGPPFR